MARMFVDFYEGAPIKEADLASLPPLVKKGENRDRILKRVVDSWLRDFCAEGATGINALQQYVDAMGFDLDGIALIDENLEGEPIDLGELLRDFENRLRQHKPRPDALPQEVRFILIRNCRIPKCDCSGITVSIPLVVHTSQFGRDVSFERTTFGNAVKISRTRFTHNVVFRHCSFRNTCDFRGSRFNGVHLAGATFGANANFFQARFEGETSFSGATFSENACFRDAEIGHDSDFSEVAFLGRADFVGARIGNATKFMGTRFGSASSFGQAKLGSTVRFHSAVFGPGAIFRYASFRDRADFGGATFGDGADFTGANFGLASSFYSARFGRWVKFKGTLLEDADLRETREFLGLPGPGKRGRLTNWVFVHRGLVVDETLVRGAQFSAQASDPWSALRRAYTGPWLLLNLLFLTLFFVPFVVRTAGWYAAGKAEQELVVLLDESDRQLEVRAHEHPQLTQFTRSQLDAIRQNLPGSASDHWRKYRVWEVVLGLDKGPALWIPAFILVFYNAVRFLLTIVVAPMRDAEERSGYSPIFRPIPRRKRQYEYREELNLPEAEESKWKPSWLDHVVIFYRYLTGYLESYRWLVWPHRVLTWMFWFAFASFVWNAFKWMSMTVWLPA